MNPRPISAPRDTVKRKPQRKRNPIRTERLDSLTTMGMGVAHDFNNLLTAILGNAIVIKQQRSGTGPVTESMAQIEKCALRGLAMTNRILTFTGRAPFAPRSVNLSTLVRDMRPRLEQTHDGSTRIQCRLDRNLPELPGDQEQIQQMLLDLVTNSAESLVERPGTITIETGVTTCDRDYLHLVALGADPLPGQYAYLQVVDNGRGISARVQKHIFDPFFTTKLRGQGLGLCVVVGVLRAHGGGLEVWSRAHRGSCFKALFPLARD